MDTQLRQLERQALSDPEALARLVSTKLRLGYQERSEQVGSSAVYSGSPYTPEDFSKLVDSCIKSKDRAKYHRFTWGFSVDASVSYGYCGDDAYVDSDDIELTLYVSGVRLETEKEMKWRNKQLTDREEAIKKQRRAESKVRRDAKKSRDDQERETYNRLKRKFESEEKTEQLLASIGEAAEASLREYSPSYFKSWFYRKFKKLGGKTPTEIYDEGDIDKLRLFALKTL
jgi:hypothetical protein